MGKLSEKPINPRMAARVIGHRRKLEIQMPGRHLISGFAKDRQLSDLIGAGALQKLQARERHPLKGSTSHHAGGLIVDQGPACAVNHLRNTKLDGPLIGEGLRYALFL